MEGIIYVNNGKGRPGQRTSQKIDTIRQTMLEATAIPGKVCVLPVVHKNFLFFCLSMDRCYSAKQVVYGLFPLGECFPLRAKNNRN